MLSSSCMPGAQPAHGDYTLSQRVPGAIYMTVATVERKYPATRNGTCRLCVFKDDPYECHMHACDRGLWTSQANWAALLLTGVV